MYPLPVYSYRSFLSEYSIRTLRLKTSLPLIVLLAGNLLKIRLSLAFQMTISKTFATRSILETFPCIYKPIETTHQKRKKKLFLCIVVVAIHTLEHKGDSSQFLRDLIRNHFSIRPDSICIIGSYQLSEAT